MIEFNLDCLKPKPDTYIQDRLDALGGRLMNNHQDYLLAHYRLSKQIREETETLQQLILGLILCLLLNIVLTVCV